MINRYSFLILCGLAVLYIGTGVAGTSIPADDWKIAGPFGGTATTVAVNPKTPSTVLAGGMDSLLFRSEDGGSNWQLLDLPKRSLSEVTAIVVDPANTNHYLVGMIATDDPGLFESFDAGNTWTEVKDISGFGVRALAVADSDASRMVAGTQHGVMLTKDSGKTWTRISDPANLEMSSITAVAIDPKDPNIIYAGTSHLPWRTLDGGKTWDSIHDGMIDDSDVFSLYVDPQEPAKIFASACSGIYSSDDRGALWHKLMGIPNTSRRTHVVRFERGTCCGDPNLPGAVYAGTTTGLFRSLNSGKTWKTLTGLQVNALAFDPSKPNTLYLALEHAGIGRSNDGGEAIEPVNNGFVDRVISSLTLSGSKFVAIEPQNAESSGIFVSGDKGDSWTQVRNPKGIAGVHLRTITGFLSEEHILIAASSNQMYKSIDGGIVWKTLPLRVVTPPPPASNKPQPAKPAARSARGKTPARAAATRTVKPKPIFHEISPLDIRGLYTTRNGSKDMVFAATDLGLLKSEDMGEYWMRADIPASFEVTGLYISPSLDGKLIARTSGGLYRSDDYGDHWALMPFPRPFSDVYDVAIPADPSCPLLVATRVGLYTSTDGGANWYTNASGIPASTVSAVLYRGSTAYAVEYGQLYQSSDAAKTWKDLQSSIRGLRIRQLWTPGSNSDRIYAITADLGIIFRN